MTVTSDDPLAASMAASIVKAYRENASTAQTALAADEQQAASMAAEIMAVYRRHNPQTGDEQ